jgi:tetratricopeptide (TPR) repeat protein
MLQKALDIRRGALGELNEDTLISMNNLALLHDKQGRYSEAESLYLKAREISRRLFGDKHSNTLISTNNLAVLYKRQGRYDRAKPLYLEALEISRRVLGDRDPNNAGICRQTRRSMRSVG